MRITRYPSRRQWPQLALRPQEDSAAVADRVSEIINAVRLGGDDAVRKIAAQFEKSAPNSFAVSESEINAAIDAVPDELKRAIETAAGNIRRFHAHSTGIAKEIETSLGVFCSRKWQPIDTVGLYIPAGSAPLFSTVLMLAIPANIAGCREIIICSPPSATGSIDAATLFTASLCGVSKIFKIGGAQAIAAMAFGTETIPRVDKIFGPGNRFVTEAKLQVLRFSVAIDMPAGPSELLVIADDGCRPEFVAADLLSQAEHGPDSQVILLTDSETTAFRVASCIEDQLRNLPRRTIAEKALENSRCIILSSIDECIQFSNLYAPEHLILALRNAEDAAENIVNAGSVFVGDFACESAGDYASGTNHTLPTAGAARGFSGITTESFMKTITFQRITREGIAGLAPTIEKMAAAEGLDGHRLAAAIRRGGVAE
ncbi:MAG: histidinol dehydrogenase [Blastocatellia bacterium]